MHLYHQSRALKYHSDFNPAGLIYQEVKLFRCFMLPELTTRHSLCYIKRCFIYNFAIYNS